jgi:hypothetical protein
MLMLRRDIFDRSNSHATLNTCINLVSDDIVVILDSIQVGRKIFCWIVTFELCIGSAKTEIGQSLF